MMQARHVCLSRNRLPKCCFGSLKGLSTEETAMILQDRLAGGGILATLDFSQAYDKMSPEISRAFLISLGWDNDFCQLWARSGPRSKDMFSGKTPRYHVF